MWKGDRLSIGGKRKGYLFFQKGYIKGKGPAPSGASLIKRRLVAPRAFSLTFWKLALRCTWEWIESSAGPRTGASGRSIRDLSILTESFHNGPSTWLSWQTVFLFSLPQRRRTRVSAETNNAAFIYFQYVNIINERITLRTKACYFFAVLLKHLKHVGVLKEYVARENLTAHHGRMRKSQWDSTPLRR